MKVKNCSWGLELVCKAMKTARSYKSKARIEEEAEQTEIDVGERMLRSSIAICIAQREVIGIELRTEFLRAMRTRNIGPAPGY